MHCDLLEKMTLVKADISENSYRIYVSVFSYLVLGRNTVISGNPHKCTNTENNVALKISNHLMDKYGLLQLGSFFVPLHNSDLIVIKLYPPAIAEMFSSTTSDGTKNTKVQTVRPVADKPTVQPVCLSCLIWR